MVDRAACDASGFFVRVAVQRDKAQKRHWGHFPILAKTSGVVAGGAQSPTSTCRNLLLSLRDTRSLGVLSPSLFEHTPRVTVAQKEQCAPMGMPNDINGRIQWYEQRISGWKAAPATIGLTLAQATALETLIKAARTAYDAAQAARIAAKNATLGLRNAFNTMSGTGADDIRYIRAFAESQATPAAQLAVYQAASIDPPAPPTPAGPPVPPTDVVGDPNADGTVTLKWKGSTASQTFFTVWRRTGSNTTWVQVGAVASKTFIDATVPAGTPSVRYYVRAQRNTEVSGNSDETIVNFGQAA